MSEETKPVSDQRKPVRNDIITQQDIDDLEEVLKEMSNQVPRAVYEEALAQADRLAEALNRAGNYLEFDMHSAPLKLNEALADFRKWREGR